MKIKDRILIVRRALIVALNPQTESVLVRVIERGGNTYSRSIFTDKKKATELFTEDVMSMWRQGASCADELARRVTGFAKMIQEKWNEEHPEDLANFITEKDSSN